MGLMPWVTFSDTFNVTLESALDAWDPGGDGYAEGRWDKIRRAKVPRSLPHAGELALDAIAVALVQNEADPILTVPYVYPHPAGSGSHSGGFIHTTRGIPGNMALDFMAPGGTEIVAPFAGRITRLSGHDPATGVHGSDIFGWSIYLERADGMFAFMTHDGTKDVHVGQQVKLAQKIATVGHWPHDPGRSHTHLGITSPRGTRDAVHILLSIASAPRVPDA
jgi:murein DD-endopeptidase MepM/ murein hydrolase activator NlpD